MPMKSSPSQITRNTLSGSATHLGNGVYRVELTTAERVAAQYWVFDGTSTTAGVEVAPAPVREKLGGSATIKLLSPYHAKTKRLELVQRADFTNASAIGPIRVTPEFTVTVGDVVRFGATFGEETIRATASIVDIAGELTAEVELTKEDTDKTASEHWRWELEHVTAGGDVSPIVMDKEMTLHPSHAEAD